MVIFTDWPVIRIKPFKLNSIIFNGLQTANQKWMNHVTHLHIGHLPPRVIYTCGPGNQAPMALYIQIQINSKKSISPPHFIMRPISGNYANFLLGFLEILPLFRQWGQLTAVAVAADQRSFKFFDGRWPHGVCWTPPPPPPPPPPRSIKPLHLDISSSAWRSLNLPFLLYFRCTWWRDQ